MTMPTNDPTDADGVSVTAKIKRWSYYSGRQNKEGYWVKYSDYDTLRSEVERLRAELAEKDKAVAKLQASLVPAYDENAALRTRLADAERDRDQFDEARIKLVEENNGLRAELAWAEARAALAKIDDSVCLACGGTGGHWEGCQGTTGLIALSVEVSDLHRQLRERDGLLERAKIYAEAAEYDEGWQEDGKKDAKLWLRDLAALKPLGEQ